MTKKPMLRKKYEITGYINLLGLAPDSQIHPTAKIYEGVKFREPIKLIMEKNTFIGTNCTILVPELIMREGSQINANTVISGKDPVVLGRNVVIGYSCVILTSSDKPNQGKPMNDATPEKERNIMRGPVIIKDNCFIGSQSLIMPFVTIEEGIIVKAKSYVDDNLSLSYHIYKGNFKVRSVKND